MVLATLPRKLSPGEKVTLPVTVFAMENKVKNVNLSLKLSEGITVKGQQTQSLQFDRLQKFLAISHFFRTHFGDFRAFSPL